MVSPATPPGQLGWKAAPFELPGVDGRRHTLESARGENGLVVMFICNHCPYVRAVIDKIVRDAHDLTVHGVGSIAIAPDGPQHPGHLRGDIRAPRKPALEDRAADREPPRSGALKSADLLVAGD